MEYGPYGDGLDTYGRAGYDTVNVAAISVRHQNLGAVDNITLASGSLGADGMVARLLTMHQCLRKRIDVLLS